jgi:hypothetical protein
MFGSAAAVGKAIGKDNVAMDISSNVWFMTDAACGCRLAGQKASDNG